MQLFILVHLFETFRRLVSFFPTNYIAWIFPRKCFKKACAVLISRYKTKFTNEASNPVTWSQENYCLVNFNDIVSVSKFNKWCDEYMSLDVISLTLDSCYFLSEIRFQSNLSFFCRVRLFENYGCLFPTHISKPEVMLLYFLESWANDRMKK